MRARLSSLATAAALAALALAGLAARRRILDALAHRDAAPGPPVALPYAPGAGLAPAELTRVVVLDGLSAEIAATLPALRALCDRGLAVTVDVGFPTVSLPVEVALWSGLTQQMTGYVGRDDRPLAPPLIGVPSRVPGSLAVAESHGWIARSLGFSHTEPRADPTDPTRDASPAAWEQAWRSRAIAAVAGPSRLSFVHLLAIDAAGHAHGAASPAYRAAALGADAMLADLVAAAPTARWFAVSDHGHLPGGGHGGEERELRQTAGCIAGPGVARRRGGLIHVADLARALADSTGVALDPRSPGRPLEAALAAPLGPEAALPAIPLAAGAIALLLLAAALALTIVVARRWWHAPWWLAAAWLAVVMIHGEPTLSTPFAYRRHGLALALVWAPFVALACAATVAGARRTGLGRVVVAQLALPIGAAAAALAGCGGWAAVLDAAGAPPVVPRFTAYALALLLLAALASAAVGLAAIAVAFSPRRSPSSDARPPSAPAAPGAPPR